MALIERFKQLTAAEIIGVIALALVFLGASYASERFAPVLERAIGAAGTTGMALYVLVIMGIVLIPFATTLPMIPVAVSVWGHVAAAGLTLLGWGVGAFIAFSIARRFGDAFRRRILVFQRVRELGSALPRQYYFWGTVLFGIIGMPVDMLSYALGLFTPIRPFRFLAATVIGLTPFAFFISYTATLPALYQAYIMAFLVFVWLYALIRLKERSRNRVE